MLRLTLAAVLLAFPAFAQAPAAAPDTPATAADKQAMSKMMGAMDIPYTGNADRDFVSGMLPHHLGAVDMARIELQYGHDPALKRLARDIVASQDKEVVFMRRWLQQHPQHR